MNKIHGNDIEKLEKIFNGESDLSNLRDLYNNEIKAERIKKSLEYNKKEIINYIYKNNAIAKDLIFTELAFSLILAVIMLATVIIGFNILYFPIIKFVGIFSFITALITHGALGIYANKKYNSVLKEVKDYIENLYVNEHTTDLEEDKTFTEELKKKQEYCNTNSKDKNLTLTRKRKLKKTWWGLCG